MEGTITCLSALLVHPSHLKTAIAQIWVLEWMGPMHVCFHDSTTGASSGTLRRMAHFIYFCLTFLLNPLIFIRVGFHFQRSTDTFNVS